MNNTLTALAGVRVGHATHLDKLTGCTVILFDKPYSVGYKGYGGAIGAFNTEGLKSGSSDYKENGIFIAGGSLTGLMAGCAITDYLREHKLGKQVSPAVNLPSITGAIVYDLGMNIAPFDAKYGREACENATNEPIKNGNVGAGTGTAVGKFRWIENGTKSGAMKSGVGSARVNLGNGITVCALSVVNALGNVVLPNGEVLAGNRDDKTTFKLYEDVQDFVTRELANTTISVVGINVDLKSKEHYERVAHLASHGQVRAINPVHTSLDGDSVFVFSTAEIKKPLNHFAQYFLETESDIHFLVDIIGQAASKAVQESIYDAVRQAESVPFDMAWQGIIPSIKDYPQK